MKKKLVTLVVTIMAMILFVPVFALGEAIPDCPGGCSHEAAIGTTHYDTLQNALDSATANQTVELLKPVMGVFRMPGLTGVILDCKDIEFDPLNAAAPEDSQFKRYTKVVNGTSGVNQTITIAIDDTTNNKAELLEYINKLPTDKGKKRAEAFDKLTQAKEAALVEYNAKGSIALSVDHQKSLLIAALGEFNASPDDNTEAKANLLAKIKEAQLITQGLKTDQSFFILGQEIQTADTFYQNITNETSNEDINAALSTLIQAIEAFENSGEDITIQLEALQEQITIASNLLISEVEKRTTAAMNALRNATETAEYFIENISPTTIKQVEVEEATRVLKAAINNFYNSEDTSLPKQQLQNLINSAKDIEKGNKTEDAFYTLTSAIGDAERTLGTVGIDTDSIDISKINLSNAISTFKVSPEDIVAETKALDDKIAEAEAIKIENYTQRAYDDLQLEINTTKNFKTTITGKTKEEVNSATTRLDNGIKRFKSSEDTTDARESLQSNINLAKSFPIGNKTEDAFNKLTNAISTAEQVIDTKGLTINDIQKAELTLDDDIRNFNNSPEDIVAETKALDDKIIEAKAIEIENHTNAAFEQLQTAITTAENFKRTITGKTKAAVNEATDTLNDAINEFASSEDTTEARSLLQAQINLAKSTQIGNKTQSEFNKLTKAIEKAEAAQKVVGSNIETINLAKAEISGAITIFNNSNEDIVAETKALDDKIAEAEAIEIENYTQGAFETLQSAILTAKNFKLSITGKTKDEVNRVANTLHTAVEDFYASENTTAIREEVATYINSIKNVIKGNKTQAAFDQLQEDIETAENSLKVTGLTIAEVTTIKTTLKNGKDAFLASPEDIVAETKALDDKITAAKAIELGNHTVPNFAKLANAITTAENFKLTITGKTKAEVNEATNTLDLAIKAFKASEDTTEARAELQEKINLGKSIVIGNKTEAAFNELTKAINNAKNVHKTTGLTIAEVTLASTELASAIDTFNSSDEDIVAETLALDNKITAAKAIEIENHTNAAFEQLQTAITTAENFKTTITGKTKAEVNEATDTLNDAINEFESSEDTTEAKALLQTEIDKAKSIKQAAKTKEAFETLKKAIETAENAHNVIGTDIATIDNAKATLLEAINVFNKSYDIPATNTLFFNTYGGTNFANIQLAPGTIVDLTKYVPTKENATFDGWYKDAKYTEKVTKVKLDSNVIVHAKWIDNSSSVEPVKPETPAFTDVVPGSYYEDAVKWAVEKGITNGVTDTTFVPEGICTRAEAVTFLYRAAGSPEVKSNVTFADVDENAYYAKAVAWAVENGITKGINENAFDPNAKCERAQIVTFLYRLANTKASTKASFTDVPAGIYYEDAVNWAVENGITNGTTNTTFAPIAKCERGQIVTFLYRYYVD